MPATLSSMNTTTRKRKGVVKVGPTTCVIYTRISKDRAEQTSLDSQEKACRAYAESRGWTVIAVCVDQGVSAFKGVTRPGLNEAMAYVTAGMAEVLLVWKLDRLVRSVVHFGETWQTLQDHSAQFASVTDNFDTSTAMGRMGLQVAVAFCELESGVKSERTSAWHDYRASLDGPALPPMGKLPFGYDRPAKNTLVPNKRQAAALNKAVKMIVAGESLRAAARAIDKPVVTLRAVLLSPTTYGLRDIDGELRPGNWLPILDDETRVYFAEKFKDAKRTFNGRKYLMSGLLTCGRCGGPMYCGKHSQSAGMRYTCFATTKGCALSMLAADVEGKVDALITGTLDKRAWKAMRDRQRPVGDSLRIEARLLELRDDYDNDLITRAEWEHSRANLLARKLDEPKDHFPLPLVDDVPAAWATMELDAKRMIVQAAFLSCVVMPQQPGVRGPDRFVVEWRD